MCETVAAVVFPVTYDSLPSCSGYSRQQLAIFGDAADPLAIGISEIQKFVHILAKLMQLARTLVPQEMGLALLGQHDIQAIVYRCRIDSAKPVGQKRALDAQPSQTEYYSARRM
jgi:hypothetical protein